MLLLEDEEVLLEEVFLVATEEETAALLAEEELEETELAVGLAVVVGIVVATGAPELEEEEGLCLAGHARVVEMAETAMSKLWNFMMFGKMDASAVK